MILAALSRTGQALVLASALYASVFSGAELAVPPLTGHVIDQTGTLTAEQTAALEQTLTEVETRKGSQLAVLMLPTTQPEAIEAFALRVAEQWKLGRKKVDDGAILVIAKNDRALRLEVGYGLEGALNDATSKRIISEIILPHFKQQDFYGGIAAGVGQIIRVIDGEPLPAPGQTKPGELGDIESYLPFLFILALAVGGVLRRLLGKVPGSLITGGVVGVFVWFFIGAVSLALLAGVMALVVTLLGNGLVRHGFGGYYGGGGGRGGGGGGFQGGGGGFGGGGASGRW